MGLDMDLDMGIQEHRTEDGCIYTTRSNIEYH